jgi:hypothetical protein
MHLFKPRTSSRLPGGSSDTPSKTEGQNPPAGVVIHYYLKEEPAKDANITLEILQADGTLVRRFTPKAEQAADKLEPKKGMNRLVWNLRYPEAESFPGMILWGSLQGPRAVPGSYQARLTLGEQSQTATFEVRPDPRVSVTAEDLQVQFRFLLAVRDKLTETHRAIKQIRDIREQLTNLSKRLTPSTQGGGQEGVGELIDAAKAIEKKLTAIEETLYQTKARSPQDVLNYPIRLNNKLSALAGTVGMGDNRPTDQAIGVKEELTAQIDAELAKLQQTLEVDLPRFNDLLARKGIPGIFAEPARGDGRGR